MLMTLLFFACLDIDRCQKVEMPWSGSYMQCVIFGQNEAADWINHHKGWTMHGGYRCLSGHPL